MNPSVSVPDGDPVDQPTHDDGGVPEQQAVRTAERFMTRLAEHASEEVRERLRGYIETPPETRLLLGVPIQQVFAVGREFGELSMRELELLLCREEHEVRVGAVFVMSEQARARLAPPGRRRRLYELYLRRIDRFDNWDLVDLGAPHVLGGYLLDRPRGMLYALARSGCRWARRGAVLAALRLVRAGETEDACALAQLLIEDPEDVVQRPIGGLLREVGRVDPMRLAAFLEPNVERLRPPALRTLLEPLDEPPPAPR